MSGYAIIDPIKSTYGLHGMYTLFLLCILVFEYVIVQLHTKLTFLIARCLVCSSSQDCEAILSRKLCITLLVISATLSCEAIVIACT